MLLKTKAFTAMIFVSSNEWNRVKIYLGENGFKMELPFDFQFYTERGLVAVERKKFPGDFLASVADGRLARECASMREAADYGVVISEGKPRYKDSRLLSGRKILNWNKKAIRNLYRSIRYVESCDVEFSDNIQDTVQILLELQQYFDKEKHLSIRNRSGFDSAWPYPTYRERFVYWIQGCGAGIKASRAEEIANIFHSPMELFNASVSDIRQVPGIGSKMSESIYNFLRGIH